MSLRTVEHNRANVQDGFGDVSFLGKYRIVVRPEGRGNYILTLFLGASVPTGSHLNGARAGAFTPAIFGWKRLGQVRCAKHIFRRTPDKPHENDRARHRMEYSVAVSCLSQTLARVRNQFYVVGGRHTRWETSDLCDTRNRCGPLSDQQSSPGRGG
jgi:hypothetical protein